MKVGFLITARLKSTRLPKKLLKEIDGVTMIAQMTRRLKLAPELDMIAIATSVNPEDDPLEEVAAREGVSCFRGSEEDVIDRLYAASQTYDLDYVVNMTADCPLLPYDYVGQLIDTYRQTDADLVTCYDFPPGIFLSGLKIESMKRLLELKDSANTEYWLYYYLKTDLFKVVPLAIPEHLKKPYRVALDYPEDFEMFEKLYVGLGESAYSKTTEEVISFLDRHPEIVKINQHCMQLGKERTDADPHSKVKLKN